jgi:multidrug efflux pump subunit AcrA (membrane-fusion protein)
MTANLKTIIFLAWLAAAVLLLSSCDGLDARAESTPDPVQAEESAPLINATGVVLPAQQAALSLQSAGQAAEVLVAEGDRVQAGQVLVRLAGKEAAEAAVAAARLDLLDARQALDRLQEDAALRAAQAQQDITAAQEAVVAAERELDDYDEDKYEDDLDRARERMVDESEDLQDAKDDFAPYQDLDPENNTRETYEDRLRDAQDDYDEAVRKHTLLLNDRATAEASLKAAQAQLADAKRRAEAYQNGPDPKDVALAQARLDNARSQLAAAEAGLRNLELTAPFDGELSRLSIDQHEWVSAGQTVALLAWAGPLRVETTDLNEIDAARVHVGDPVTVKFDALPDVEVSGSVTRIAPMPTEGSGVNFTAIVELDEIPEALRWGMTAFVDIAIQERQQ